MPTRRARSAAAIACVLISVGSAAACSDAPAEGWMELEGERLSLEVPDDLTDGEGSGERWTTAVRGDDVSVQVADPFDNSRILSSALGRMHLASTLGVDDWEPGEVRDIEVEGADSAVLQTFTYADGSSTAQGAWIIVGQAQPPTTVAVTIAGTGVDTELISRIRDSLVYEHSDERVDQDGRPLEADAA